jgi:hypothetical protein
MFAACPDPGLARRCFVGLCLIRASPGVRDAIQKDLGSVKPWQPWQQIRLLFSILLAGIDNSPEEYPFCLSDREFAYYSKQNFGDVIPNVLGIYKPPNFYQQLAFAVGGVAVGVGIVALAGALIPEEAVGAAGLGAMAPGLARGMITGGMSFASDKFFSADPFDAATKNRLWPRYQLDYQRRLLR